MSGLVSRGMDWKLRQWKGRCGSARDSSDAVLEISRWTFETVVGVPQVIIYPPVIKHGCLENGPFKGDFPVKTSIYTGISFAMFDYQGGI